MSLGLTKLGVDVFSPTDADGDPRSVENADAQRWTSEIERLLIAIIAGIVGDIDLPNLLVRATVTGGSANNIVAQPNLPLTAPGTQLISLTTTAANTGPMTLNLGSGAKPLLTNGGQQIAAGEVHVGDMFLLADAGDHYRLYADPSSLRNKEAAELAQHLAEAAQFAAHAAQVAAEEARDIAAGYASDAVSQGNVPIYATAIGVAALEVPEGINAIRINGYSAAGDGGAALYKRVETEPSHAGKIQSADGAWWELAEETVTPEMVGAAGDGNGDDTAALQLALVIGRPVKGRRGATYKLTETVTIPPYTDFDGQGCIIDMSSISGVRDGLVAAGGYLEPTGSALAANGVERSYTVTVGNGAIFSPGEDVLLSSEGFYLYNGYNAAKGEYKRIRSIDGNVITFTTPLNDTYLSGTGADSARLRKVHFIDGVRLRNFSLIGSGAPTSGERGICLRYCRDFEIENVSVDGQHIYQIEVSACLRGRVKDANVNGVYYDGTTGNIFYGIMIVDCSTDIIVDGAIGMRNRHLVVTSSRTAGQGFYGEPCDITVVNCHQKDSQSGGPGRSFAFEVHGFGRNVKFIGCTADGCYSFARLENARGCQVKACAVRNYDHNAIVIGGNGLDNRDIDVDLVADGYTGMLTSSAAAAVWFNPSGGGNFNNIRVNIKATRTRNPANTFGLGVRAGAAGYRDVIVSGIIEAGVADANQACCVIDSGAGNVRIEDLTTVGYRTGVNSAALNTFVRRCNFKRIPAAEATGAGVIASANGVRIQFCEAQNLATAWQVSGGNGIITNNVARACTNNVADTGSNNIVRDNDAF